MKIQQMNPYDYLPEMVDPDPEKGCGTCRFWTYMGDAKIFVCKCKNELTKIDDCCENWEKRGGSWH